MCGVTRNKRVNLVSYRKKIDTQVAPEHGETLLGHANRLAKLSRETRNLYLTSHETKHFCHYGPFPCYICPIWDGFDITTSDIIEIIQTISKVTKKEFVWQISSKRPLGYWKLLTIR